MYVEAKASDISVVFLGGHSVEILNARMTHALRSWQFWFIWE